MKKHMGNISIGPPGIRIPMRELLGASAAHTSVVFGRVLK